MVTKNKGRKQKKSAKRTFVSVSDLGNIVSSIERLDRNMEKMMELIDLLAINVKSGDIEKLYEVTDVMEILGVTKHTVRAFIHDGSLKASRIGKNFRISKEDLKEFIESNKFDPSQEVDGESE